MKTINSYLCPPCFSGHPIAAELRTGAFIQHSSQLVHLQRHSTSNPLKPTGSVFLDSGVDAYNRGAQEFGVRGWAGFESDGQIVMFAALTGPFATMENRGVSTTPTSTGKMVLCHLPPHRHYFGVSGRPGSNPVCNDCGRTWCW